MNHHIEQLLQTLEEIKNDSKEYLRLDKLLRKLNQADKFEETLERVDELIKK